MKRGEYVRRIDELGRIVLPAEVRGAFHWREGDKIEIMIREDGILLTKKEPDCIFCGGTEELIAYGGRTICDKCAKRVFALAGAKGCKVGV